jgi:hypothetical protein
MSSGGGRRKTRTVYMPAPAAPVQQDNSMAAMLAYMQSSEARADARAAAERREREAKEAARKAAGAQGLPDFQNLLQSQLKSGLITYEDAASQLQNYSSRYDLDPGAPTQAGQALGEYYTQSLRPERQVRGVERLYQDLLGREMTAEERERYFQPVEADATGGYQGYMGLTAGYEDIQDVRQSLMSSEEYTNKLNDSYLENYYDTVFGKQTRDEKNAGTKKRTFAFNQELLPGYADLAGLQEQTGIKLPNYENYFGEARSVKELEEGIQGIRDTRQYLYSTGLTNLQGEIDKDLQKIKSKADIKKQQIGSQGGVLQQIAGAFSF